MDAQVAEPNQLLAELHPGPFADPGQDPAQLPLRGDDLHLVRRTRPLLQDEADDANRCVRQVIEFGPHVSAFPDGQPSVHRPQERARIRPQVVRIGGLDRAQLSRLPLPACLRQPVPYDDAVLVVQPVQIEYRVVDRPPIVVPPDEAMQVAHDSNDTLPGIGAQRPIDLGHRQDRQVGPRDPPHPQTEGRSGHQEVPGRERGSEYAGDEVRGVRPGATKRYAEECIGIERDDCLLRHHHDEERLFLPYELVYENGGIVRFAAAITGCRYGVQLRVDLAESRLERPVVFPQMVEQQQVVAVAEERRLEQRRVALPTGQGKRGDVAWRDFDGVAALAGRRPASLREHHPVRFPVVVTRQHRHGRHVGPRKQPIRQV